MKTQKQYALQKSMMSKDTFGNMIIRDIETLQKECQYESDRLLKLRKEIRDIELKTEAFEAEKRSAERTNAEFLKDSDIVTANMLELGKKNSKKVFDAQKHLNKAHETLKIADSRLKIALAIEKITVDISNVTQARVQKAIEIETRNEKSLRIIVDQQEKSAVMMSQVKLERKALAKEKNECAIKVLELNVLQKESETTRKENKATLEAAKQIQANAKKTLEEAVEKSKFSQRSVERQWATVEVEQGKVRDRILRIKKFCIENKIDWNNIDPEE
mgnify:CR=1 FL=1